MKKFEIAFSYNEENRPIKYIVTNSKDKILISEASCKDYFQDLMFKIKTNSDVSIYGYSTKKINSNIKTVLEDNILKIYLIPNIKYNSETKSLKIEKEHAERLNDIYEQLLITINKSEYYVPVEFEEIESGGIKYNAVVLTLNTNIFIRSYESSYVLGVFRLYLLRNVYPKYISEKLYKIMDDYLFDFSKLIDINSKALNYYEFQKFKELATTSSTYGGFDGQIHNYSGFYNFISKNYKEQYKTSGFLSPDELKKAKDDPIINEKILIHRCLRLV